VLRLNIGPHRAEIRKRAMRVRFWPEPLPIIDRQGEEQASHSAQMAMRAQGHGDSEV